MIQYKAKYWKKDNLRNNNNPQCFLFADDFSVRLEDITINKMQCIYAHIRKTLTKTLGLKW